MRSNYYKENFDVVNGRYFWLFIALTAVFLIWSLIDCSRTAQDGEVFEECCI